MSNGAPVATDTGPQLVDALHRIYIESLPFSERTGVLERASDAVKALDLTTALRMLAESDLDRLHKWHVIASSLHREEAAFFEDEEVTNTLIDALVAIPELESPPEVVREPLADRLREFAAPQPPGVGLTPERWKEFYDNVLKQDEGLRDHATETDAYKPGCNDAPGDAGPGTPTIVSRFWTNATLDEMRPYVDPLNWEQLGSQYWKEMRPVEGPTYGPGRLRRRVPRGRPTAHRSDHRVPRRELPGGRALRPHHLPRGARP